MCRRPCGQFLGKIRRLGYRMPAGSRRERRRRIIRSVAAQLRASLVGFDPTTHTREALEMGDTKDKMKDAVDKVAEKTKDAAKSVGETVKDAGKKIKDMGK